MGNSDQREATALYFPRSLLNSITKNKFKGMASATLAPPPPTKKV